MHDPNAVAPNRRTYAEIDAREEDSVRRANAALGSHAHRSARCRNRRHSFVLEMPPQGIEP